MSRYKFPASRPRTMYWSDGVGGCSSCPDCRTALESEHHTYGMAIRRASTIDAYMVGSRAGHFCRNCPVVVLDRDQFERHVPLAVGDAYGVGYTVMGIVDLDAVPVDKRSLPFDDETNPVPLVEFTNLAPKKPSARASQKRRPRTKRHNRRKKR